MSLPIDLKKVAVGMVASAVTAVAIAATQGTLGPTSTGSFEISYNVNAQIKIWGLEDVNLSGTTLTEKVQICTYNNNTTNLNFSLSSTQDFELRSTDTGNSDVAKYSVEVYDKGTTAGDKWGDGGHASGVQGYHQYISNNNAGVAPPDDICTAGSTSNTTELIVKSAQPLGTDGTYSDTVTLTIEAI